jgi:hypothetical protein
MAPFVPCVLLRLWFCWCACYFAAAPGPLFSAAQIGFKQLRKAMVPCNYMTNMR